MKKICFVALAALALSACNSEPKFKVEGEVSGADGKMLYLEAAALEGIVPLDSVKLKGDGSFSFKQTRPVSPEFYRLRVDDKVINFSVDSTETIGLKAPYTDFATAYTVEGSANSTKIKELTLKQVQLQNEVNELVKKMQAHQIGADVFEEKLAALMKDYKDEVKTKYIFAAPNTAAAYFALFQKLNNYYPHADRSKNLYNIVIKGMKNTRTPQQKVLELPEEVISETGIIDISLRDMKGNTHKLSDLKGKVVLLDFTIYQSAASAPHNFLLNDLYTKYKDQGLVIYQVSLDADEHFWKTTADNLPWISVRDANGIYSNVAAMYNVKEVPSLFLINRNSELSARGETIKDLDAAVKALL